MAENEMRRIRPRRRAHRERSGSASLTELGEAEESQAGEEQRDRLAGDAEGRMSWNTENTRARAGVGACAITASKIMNEATTRRI
jgi:hypothetical protein